MAQMVVEEIRKQLSLRNVTTAVDANPNQALMGHKEKEDPPAKQKEKEDPAKQKEQEDPAKQKEKENPAKQKEKDNMEKEKEMWPCPLCDSTMVIKRAGRGGMFWGCPRHPACTGTRSLAKQNQVSPVKVVRQRSNKLR